MDVASTFAVSAAPPPFQKEVEEARRDTQNRSSIPQLSEMQNSRAQTHIGDRRGNTDGANSLLAAQQQGIMDAEDDIVVDADGRKRRRRHRNSSGEGADAETEQEQEQEEPKDAFANGYEYPQRSDGNNANGDKIADPVKSGYDPITGYYEIPATKRYKRRSILLRFREQNVHFLERFSDKTTAVGLINFALCRRYGSIIPHCRLGQVVEKRT